MIEDFSKQNQVQYSREILLRDYIERAKIDDYNKVDLILCVYGFKSATEISVEAEELCADFENLCRGVSVHFLRMTRDMKRNSPAHISDKNPAYIVAKQEGDLEELRLLLEKQDSSSIDNRDDRSFGHIYGFPATAVDAFGDEAKTVKWDHKELPREIREGEVLPFVHFILSKDHWQAELAEVEKWAQVVKKVSPGLYERIISNYRGHI